MGKHETTVVVAGQGWQGRCSCRQNGKIEAEWGKANMWGLNHQQDVARTKMRLEKKGMSLERTIEYYREREADETESTEHRVLWGQMAYELERRVGPAEMPGAEPLF